MSIISMVTSLTTRLKTWCVYQALPTPNYTGLSVESSWLNWGRSASTSPKSGTVQMKEGIGTNNITKKSNISSMKKYLRFAPVVVLITWLQKALGVEMSATVQRTVRLKPEGIVVSTTSTKPVQNVVTPSARINTLLVNSVEYVSQQEEKPVYCLTVPRWGCFKLSQDSPIVANCPDAGGYYIAHQFPIIRPITQIGYRW